MSAAVLSYAGWAFLPGVCQPTIPLRQTDADIQHGSLSQDGYSQSTMA